MIVFHYTDIDNLASVLSVTSRTNQRLVLKAKHRCFLNDDAQCTFGRYILPSCIKAIEDELHVDPKMAVAPLLQQPRYLDLILQGINTYDDRKQGLDSFVLSFSEDQDNTELWEKHGNGGRGIALGFDTDKLQPDYDRFVNVFKKKCTYWSEDIKKPDFKLDPTSTLYKSILDTYKMMTDTRVIDSFSAIYGKESTAGVVSQRINNTLAQNIITTFDVFNKQDVWRNEKEYRISLSPMPVDIEFLKDKNGDYIPYANVQFPITSLRMLVIGPRCGRNSYGMVKSLFMQRGISQDIQVLESSIRLR